MLELFRRLHANGQTIVMVTHSAEVAAGAARLVRMRDGAIEADSAAPFGGGEPPAQTTTPARDAVAADVTSGAV